MTECVSLHLEKAREATKRIETIRRLVIPMARSILANGSTCLSSLARVGEQCRQVGAHDEAAQIYDRISNLDTKDSYAACLRDILTGNITNRQSVNPKPAPFRQLLNFLSTELRDELLSKAIVDVQYFENAKVHDSDLKAGATNPDIRRGKVLPGKIAEPYVNLFLPRLKNFLTGGSLLPQLGIPSSIALRYEVQVTNYSNEDFFSIHVDDGTPDLASRSVSFVYYMRRAGDNFTGGDLILYDQEPGSERRTTPNYTRIRPIDNSIVFFLSSSVHEVLPTFVESGNREDGRFSINGWLVKKS